MSDGSAWDPPAQGPWPPPGQGPGPWPPPGQGPGPWPPPGQGPGPWSPPGQGAGPWPPAGQWPPAHGGYGAPWPPPAPKPGVVPLRPLGLGEILDGSISTIRRNPKATLGFTAIVMAITTAVTTAVEAGSFRGLQKIAQPNYTGQPVTGAELRPYLGWLTALGLVSLVLWLTVTVILGGVLTAVVGRAVLGRHVTVGEAWRLARGRIGALLSLALLILGMFLLLWVATGAVIAIGALVRGPAAAILIVPAVIAVIPLTIFLWVKTSLAASAVVLERIGAVGAIGRSWRLTRKSFWRVLGIWIVSYLAILIAGLVLEIPFRIVAALVAGQGGSAFGVASGSLTGGKLLLYLVINAIGGLAAATVTRPMLFGIGALLYVDLRMRREGLDMALQTAVRDEQVTGDEFAVVWRPPARPGPAGWVPPPGPNGPPW